ncbi:MAG: rubrerythrin family protein [Planctomycetaceae bacterium]|jgi:rubrerythrin|nr:rubrerythrin family protein [Planctomycetaceae bacterium]
MTSIKGTQTEKNLLKSFAGESQARNRYTYFASQAKKDGYEHIAAIFDETANQEKEHAKRFFSFLEGGVVEVTASFPAGIIGTTAANLKASAGGEYEEWHDLYPAFAEIAKSEGFDEISRLWKAVSIAEKQHEKTYLGLLKTVEEASVFKRQGVVWRCRNCGYVSSGEKAPDLCPACNHPQSYFEVLAENW